MRSAAVKIRTCGGAARPRVVFRVAHGGNDKTPPSPFGGLRARGWGERETNPLYFQVMLQDHLKWICREKSPFMSVTNGLGRAVRVCQSYSNRGYRGVRVYTIDTATAGWDHREQRT